ncbi:Crp/Fnr family transcriptional regulator [Flagellimonas sp.]|uniref:Crp/Fnr family transcriptional regulator n=1 Tax=Flagellimonas sp. TaxID=2058762 RepID=UPI003F49C7D3
MIRTNQSLISYIRTLDNKGTYGIGASIFEPKTTIFRQNHRYGKVYVIKRGIAKCYITDENGREFIQEFLGEGMEFGELEVFSDKSTICSVASINEVEAFCFTHSLYKQLLEEDSTFNKLIMKGLADKIRYKAPRHSYQHSYPIEDNVLRLQKLFPQLTEILPKKDIANYIGVTTRSLNRALKELRQKNDGN